MNIEPIMEKICGNCHWPYAEPNEDGLKDQCDHCATCTMEADVRAAMLEAMLEAERETAVKMAKAIAGAFGDGMEKYGFGGRPEEE